MKKRWMLICAVLMCVLVGCSKAPANDKAATSKEETISLKMACQETSGAVDLDSIYAEIVIYSDEIYNFTSRNEEFIAAFTTFLESKNVSKQQGAQTGKKSISVEFYDESNGTCFALYENDVIEVLDNDEGDKFYFCEGIFNAFEKELGTYLEEHSRHYVVAPIRHMYAYAIFDKNNVVLESDCIPREPNISYNDSIAHLWVQVGTGVHTRWAKFYDVETGKVSPEYYGQTDYFGDKVCATEPSSVAVYDMFSGEEICRFDTFEKPLDNFATYTSSAYFSKDGKQIVFNYLDTEGDFQTKVFDMP